MSGLLVWVCRMIGRGVSGCFDVSGGQCLVGCGNMCKGIFELGIRVCCEKMMSDGWWGIAFGEWVTRLGGGELWP